MMKMAIRCGVVVVFIAAVAGSALGKPGDGIQPGGDLVIHPFADLSVSYDSNPRLLLKGQEEDDFFLDASPGLSVAWTKEVLSLQGLVRSRFRRFADLTSEDTEDWSEQLRLGLRLREDWRLQLRESYGRASDYNLSTRTADAGDAGDAEGPAVDVMDRSERVERDLLDCGVGLGGSLTEKMTLDVACGYGTINYRSPDMFDSTLQKASATLGRKVTDKAGAILVFDYNQMENDSFDNPAISYAGRVGWRWQGTFKSRLQASAGYYMFSADEPGLGDTLDRDGFSYDVAWYWQAKPKLSFALGGSSGVQLDATSAQNASEVKTLTGSAQYSATRRLLFALRAGYRYADYNREEMVDSALVKRETEQLHTGLRCSYQFRKWLNGYGDVWQEDTQDNVRGDYVETRGTLGLMAQY